LQAKQDQSNPFAEQESAPNLISLISLLFHPLLPEFGAKLVTVRATVLCNASCHHFLPITECAPVGVGYQRSDFRRR
jgi:hypothetical protein